MNSKMPVSSARRRSKARWLLNIILGMYRARWRSLAIKSLFLVLGFLAVSALIEHVLERRDRARLTTGDTFYTTQGRRIRYHLTGQHNPGPTLVLLNGATASLEQWEGVQAALSTDSPVISYDRGGTGFSDPANEHDANADADELNQLLHSPEIKGPFVLVSYSSSSMMAAVFVARHLDVVKGIVFVEPSPLGLPSLPGAGRSTYRRVFWRYNLYAIQSFFGYTRLRLAMNEWHSTPNFSPAEERYNAIIKSWHHWLASTYDVMTLDTSVTEAAAALATHPFSHLPLGVLVTIDPTESEYLKKVFERYETLAASSQLGVMRVARGNHDRLLKDPVILVSTRDLVRAIADKSRAEAAAVVAPKL
jgi:pimeloyl-ACP methyl ester carboxylesterase